MSTKTVIMTILSCLGITLHTLNTSKSRIDTPTVISKPAKAAFGIRDAIGAAAHKIIIKIRAWTIIESLFLAPDLMFNTVAGVVPAPIIPPNIKDIALPIP